MKKGFEKHIIGIKLMASKDSEISFAIYSPSYDENSGGIIVLHLLCHYLNELGLNASIVPHFANEEVNIFNFQGALNRLSNNIHYLDDFQLMPDRNVKLYDLPFEQIRNRNDLVVIYPETTFGNPLEARKITRWLLHTPGFFTKKVYFSPGEVQFLYSEAFTPVVFESFEIADLPLKIIHVPRDLYRLPVRNDTVRSGTAYCLRKGKGRKLIHDVTNSVLIDDLSHREIAQIFQQVEYFISYDSDTLFSWLAPLCGAKSILIPDATNNANQKKLYANYPGIAYGFDDLARAQQTLPDLFNYLDSIERLNLESVRRFSSFWRDRGVGYEADDAVQPKSDSLDLRRATIVMRSLRDIDNILDQNLELKKGIEEIRASLSWKITKPLRCFSKFCRDVLQISK